MFTTKWFVIWRRENIIIIIMITNVEYIHNLSRLGDVGKEYVELVPNNVCSYIASYD